MAGNVQHRILNIIAMNPLIKNSKLKIKNCPSPLGNASGAVLLTVVVIIIIVGLAGGAIYSFTSTSTFTQLMAQNATKAYFMAESGFRVVASEYNNAPDPKNDILESLHGTSLSLAGNAGQFDMKLYPYWFSVNSAYTANTANINVKIPGGTPLINPADEGSSKITYPNSGYLKLQGKTQLATITSVSPPSPGDGATITFGINPGFPFDIQTDDEIFLVYSDNNTTSQPVSQGGSIDFPYTNSAARILPAQNGSFRVYNEDNDKMDYTYLERTPQIVDPANPPTTITLNGIQHQDDGNPSIFPFTVDNTSEIYFGRNLAVFYTSTVGSGNKAAKNTGGNYTDVGIGGGFSRGKDTISFEDDIDDFSPTMNDPDPGIGNPDPIEIHDETIELGGDLADGYGSVWYKGDSDIANCIDGKCFLGKGFRAYFEFQFDDTDNEPESRDHGDGFTFSLVSGAHYTDGDTGLDGEYMGYAGAGLSSNGLQPPKLAVEVDTYPNPGAGNVCLCAGGDGDDSRRDDTPVANHAALVYWGEETVGSLSTDGGYLRIGSATPATGDNEDWSSSQGTISFWFKRDATFYGDGGSNGDRLWGQDVNMETRFNSTGTNFALDWGSGGNSEGAIDTGNEFTATNTWYFIAITWDDDDLINDLKVYWADETTPISLLAENTDWTGDMSAISLITENLFMNSRGGNESRNFAVEGKGSDLRYYDVARTFTNIQDDYKKRLTGIETDYNDLLAYFPLQADLADASLSGITAAAMGTTGWSADTISAFDCGTGAASYDDNRHGAGNTGTTTPQNSLNSNPGNGFDGYHQVTKVPIDPNWLENGALHRLRMELIRPLVLAEDGKVDTVYDYQVKVWIDCATCSAAELAQFEDVRAAFSGSLPDIEKTVNEGSSLEIDPADHDDLIRVLFGFTQGTSSVTQNITLRNLELYFLREYPVSDLATW
jgi:hypothetical protein